MGPRPLAILCLAFGLLLYVAAIGGVLFDAATPPGDVGALSTLVTFLLFGGLAFLLGRQGPPAPSSSYPSYSPSSHPR